MGFHPVDAGSNPVRTNLRFVLWRGDREEVRWLNRRGLRIGWWQTGICPVSVVDARDASNVVDRVRFLDWVLITRNLAECEFRNPRSNRSQTSYWVRNAP